ncbi:Major intrinsic protein - like 10 [Theobroma cacao]|uniref:Nodulin-26 n=2 Tax=Theobroma cacao TaxID=3641 RepID=A0AB32UVU0_THECC|nr:PREDICTED: nodulin-26 [Theobroma cacao]EOY15995.1 Aquaporin, MIP family, NIP subfamily isoform 1 [Theobroma cacao]WRX31471.1 Major intrinsic protein - like 10 [Theobroma cacao]
MANTPSISEEFSPKLSPTKHTIMEVVSPKLSPTKHTIMEVVSPKLPLPTKYSIMEEAKASRSREFHINHDIPPSNLQKTVAELVGTYFLIFAGCAAALVNEVQTLTIVGIAIVWGLVLMAAIYALGHISGAHFNPAVTLALAAARKFSWKLVPMYLLAQLLGAALASLTLRVLFHDQGGIQATMTQYKDSTSDLEAITWEFIITFILMFNICAVATDHRASRDLAGVAIGATLLFNVIIAGPITGASMNPARSLGPAVVSGVYKNLWVFIVAPILGAMAATLVYSILRVPKPEKPDESTKSMYNELYIHPEV